LRQANSCIMKYFLNSFLLFLIIICFFAAACLAENIKEPNVSGSFYPSDRAQLSSMIDGFLDSAHPEAIDDDVFVLILPHAGYGFSGETAAYGYKLIKGKPYKTVVILGTSHQHSFNGVSVYPEGSFRTPLGDLEIDSEFTKLLLNKDPDIGFNEEAFSKEHSVEVQLPFLQKTLSAFRIVPIVVGDCTLATCQKLADLLKEAIGARKDVLVVVSTDLYHGYDYEENEVVDNLTLSYIKNMDSDGLYNGLREGKLQACGGFGAVSAIILAKESGYNQAKLLQYTNSAQVTGNKTKGVWSVGYASIAIGGAKGENKMLNKEQRRKLLEIARKTIETYLKTQEKLPLEENDPALLKEMGAFVTLHEEGALRGCIGNLVGKAPLYLTIRDMAIEAATGDPRFAPVKSVDLKDIEIEISVLTPMERIYDSEKIVMGTHGVLVKKGYKSGVFLPQVATETGWSREEFLSTLCAQKAGLPSDAWKDKDTELYIFTAEIFSEKDY